MATEIKGTTARNGEVSLTRFCGNTEEGLCVQVTPENGQPYLSLTKGQALELGEALLQFVNGTREEV